MIDRLRVNLGERSYDIHFGTSQADIAAALIEALGRAGRKAVVLTDHNVSAALAESIKPLIGTTPVLSVQPGENSKSLEGLGEVLNFLAEKRVDRAGVLVAIGGGGDWRSRWIRGGHLAAWNRSHSGADNVAGDGR